MFLLQNTTPPPHVYHIHIVHVSPISTPTHSVTGPNCLLTLAGPFHRGASLAENLFEAFDIGWARSRSDLQPQTVHFCAGHYNILLAWPLSHPHVSPLLVGVLHVGAQCDMHPCGGVGALLRRRYNRPLITRPKVRTAGVTPVISWTAVLVANQISGNQ